MTTTIFWPRLFTDRLIASLPGDKDLLILRNIENIPILPPADFWKFQEKT